MAVNDAVADDTDDANANLSSSVSGSSNTDATGLAHSSGHYFSSPGKKNMAIQTFVSCEHSDTVSKMEDERL